MNPTITLVMACLIQVACIVLQTYTYRDWKRERKALLVDLERGLEIAEQNMKFRKALQFYAEPCTWNRVSADAQHMGATASFNFGVMYGSVARIALGWKVNKEPKKK